MNKSFYVRGLFLSVLLFTSVRCAYFKNDNSNKNRSVASELAYDPRIDIQVETIDQNLKNGIEDIFSKIKRQRLYNSAKRIGGIVVSNATEPRIVSFAICLDRVEKSDNCENMQLINYSNAMTYRMGYVEFKGRGRKNGVMALVSPKFTRILFQEKGKPISFDKFPLILFDTKKINDVELNSDFNWVNSYLFTDKEQIQNVLWNGALEFTKANRMSIYDGEIVKDINDFFQLSTDLLKQKYPKEKYDYYGKKSDDLYKYFDDETGYHDSHSQVIFFDKPVICGKLEGC